MSSQDNDGIPLSHAPSGIGFKLLELPPELVELLEGDNPPILKLESSPAAGLLKAGGKTYSLRQKNTSNALILLAPAEAAAGSDSNQIPRPGMGAIATVHETIELVPDAGVAAPVPAARGKWHERFGRSR